MNILGISAYYHDSAAALVVDGVIAGAAQEERFSRKKHDAAFPALAIKYLLQDSGLTLADLDHVVFYDKPLIKFERLLETYLAYAPRGFRSFLASMPVWLKEKLFLKKLLRKELAAIHGDRVNERLPLLFTEHHQSHAASAFYPSPFEDAAVLCMDGVGEWATTSLWIGKGNTLSPQWEITFPHSIGLLYSAFTYFTGFKVNSGEYKLMGLAPYGEPKYVDLILDKLLHLKPDGSFRMDMRYFSYADGLAMTNKRFDALFGGAPRLPESPVTQREMDLAASIQAVIEQVVLTIAQNVHTETGQANLCLAGGVALNCVSNGRVLREGPFENIWVQPAAGDAGGALGAALSVWYQYLNNPRSVVARKDSMRGSYLGPKVTEADVSKNLSPYSAVYRTMTDSELMPTVARALADGKVIGWFQGRMEFGPRALGGRSILGDARNREMQSTMNLKIKHRESFRPFAPSVLAEKVGQYFEHSTASPYMLLVAPVHPDLRIDMSAEEGKRFGIDKLKVPRSAIPAVTHVDYSARIQTVHADTNPKYHALISEFERQTGCPVIVNTSFNVRGEPIVCAPEDAYQCFMRTEMDMLVIENCLFEKEAQPVLKTDTSWMQEFELD